MNRSMAAKNAKAVKYAIAESATRQAHESIVDGIRINGHFVRQCHESTLLNNMRTKRSIGGRLFYC